MDISVSELRAYCQQNGFRASIEPTGGFLVGKPGEIPLNVLHSTLCTMVGNYFGMQPSVATFTAPGYESLAAVLHRAFNQAAHGKGKERHAKGEPFTHQVMQDMARRFGVGALLGQAFKKSEESQRLPRERAVAELLGAINYLAGAVIALESADQQSPPAANDNARAAAVCASCKRGPEA